MMKRKRGSLLIDLMVTVFLLGVTGIILSATFTGGIACSRQAQNYKVALALAQKKMEQLRASNYQSLTQPCLVGEVIDSTPTASPFSFTQVDAVADQLPAGAGTLTIDDDPSGSLRRAQITVTWQDKTGAPTRNVTLTGIFADKHTRRVT